MKYLIREGKPDGAFNASSKARNDAEKIVLQAGYTLLPVRTRYGVQVKKIRKPLQAWIYRKNLSCWMDLLETLQPGDCLFIQYPLLNTTTHFDRFLRSCADKKIRTIALIHDLDSLRFTKENSSGRVVKRVAEEDRTFLNAFSIVISHNPLMSRELRGWGVERCVDLGIFDYLYPVQSPTQASFGKPLVIAGNLNPVKSGYLRDLPGIPFHFNLYGVSAENLEGKNITYKGCFPPDILPEKIEGSFGLVWDGESADSCTGAFGRYLLYNNPHKLSLYVSAGFPVIVWSESAAARFVQQEKIGICVKSIREIPERLSSLTEGEYAVLKKNVLRAGAGIRQGHSLRKALEQAEQEIF